jgi:hypothetical protein
VSTRDVERGVDISEHPIVKSDRALCPHNACTAVAEQEPSHVSHSRRGKVCECGLQMRTLVGLRNPAFRAPGVGAEVDTVVHPRQIGADQKRRWRIGVP